MDQICLDPQDKLPPPRHPSDTSTKHPPPTGQKSACAPPDIFWNSPYALCCVLSAVSVSCNLHVFVLSVALHLLLFR